MSHVHPHRGSSSSTGANQLGSGVLDIIAPPRCDRLIPWQGPHWGNGDLSALPAHCVVIRSPQATNIDDPNSRTTAGYGYSSAKRRRSKLPPGYTLLREYPIAIIRLDR